LAEERIIPSVMQTAQKKAIWKGSFFRCYGFTDRDAVLFFTARALRLSRLRPMR
jgi:hypothetical protein